MVLARPCETFQFVFAFLMKNLKQSAFSSLPLPRVYAYTFGLSLSSNLYFPYTSTGLFFLKFNQLPEIIQTTVRIFLFQCRIDICIIRINCNPGCARCKTCIRTVRPIEKVYGHYPCFQILRVPEIEACRHVYLSDAGIHL